MSLTYRASYQILIEVLQFIRDNPKTNKSRICVYCNLCYENISQRLSFLLEHGLIKKTDVEIKGYRLDGTPKKTNTKALFEITELGIDTLQKISKGNGVMWY